MSPSLSELLKLPAGERAELAMALWEGLSEAERDPELRMSKRNWVCFDCRSVVRREAYTVDSVVCAACSGPRVNLGYKIPILAKTRAKDWELLREQYFASQRAAARVQREAEQERRRDLQKEIERLESRPANPGRLKAAQLLRKKLRDTNV